MVHKYETYNEIDEIPFNKVELLLDIAGLSDDALLEVAKKATRFTDFNGELCRFKEQIILGVERLEDIQECMLSGTNGKKEKRFTIVNWLVGALRKPNPPLMTSDKIESWEYRTKIFSESTIPAIFARSPYKVAGRLVFSIDWGDYEAIIKCILKCIESNIEASAYFISPIRQRITSSLINDEERDGLLSILQKIEQQRLWRGRKEYTKENFSSELGKRVAMNRFRIRQKIITAREEKPLRQNGIKFRPTRKVFS